MLTEKHSYVDLSLFQVMSGLQYAFPKTMKKLAPKQRHLRNLHASCEARIEAYLADRPHPLQHRRHLPTYPELED